MEGDPLEEGGELRKVLGLRWDTQEDKICVDIKLNYGEKVKGAYLEEDAPLTDPESALPQVITRRVLWRVAQSQYDPLGLLSVYMVKWKLLMRKVTLKGKEGGWETPLHKEEEEEFRQLLRDLKELREIRFPRCIQPLQGQFKNPMLLVFGDGSREACCTSAYLRWERDDGTARCLLVTGKTQVAYNAHTNPLFLQNKILPFDKLILQSKLLFMHSVDYNYAPQSFNGIWVKNNTRDMDHDLRNRDEYSVPFIRIEQFRKNPIVSLPKAWNELCDELRFQHNRTTFKIALEDYLFEQLITA
jgi:hypothetical protein